MPDYSLVPVDYQPDFNDYSFPLTTIRSPRMAWLNRRSFNSRRHRLNRRNHSRKASRKSLRREPVNPMPVRRLQAVF